MSDFYSLSGAFGDLFKATKEKCPIHHKPMIEAPRVGKICPLCEKEKLDKAENEMVKKIYDDNARKTLLTKSLIDDPETYSCTFSSYITKNDTIEGNLKQQARLIAGQYLKQPDAKFNTILSGPPGVGKTHLAMAILNAVNDNAKPAQKCVFMNVVSLFMQIRSSFDDSTSWWTEKNVERFLKDVNLVVIDDLGSESAMSSGPRDATQFVQTILYNITNSQRRIIFTTNLTQTQLVKTYNSKVVSRILRGTKGHILNFNGIKDKRIGAF
ncbi:DnaA ATPase domain-containing protein [Lactobacillus gasseri]|uniref:ATP-binding protein n=1 Tax=Lactobacillus gasseri TaxID=1596 RepID=A0AB33CBY0_LACGS|nr:DnaA/Hda family protein [Lactobacillus gasseri]ART99207.1 ATP-binding protein [Lactobacillus gasseri]